MEISNSSIGNALSATNTFIAIAALIVAVAAIVLGVYVYKMERKIKEMKDVVSEKEEEVKKLTGDINKDIEGLFERIRREDTKAYLKRLIDVPRDVSNLGDILFARPLLDEDYSSLKRAYQKLKEDNDDTKVFGDSITFGEMYLSLFFQHFPGKSILDVEMRQEILSFLLYGVCAAFPNDIEKEVKEIGVVLSNKNALDNREHVLYLLLAAIDQSEYKDDKNILQLLKDSVNDDALWDLVNVEIAEKKKSKVEKNGK